MRVIEILEKIKGTIKTNKSLDKEFEGVYAGDLLSHVMAHAKENNMFLTIMANINAIAVASLLDMPVVVFAEATYKLVPEASYNIPCSTLKFSPSTVNVL